MIDAKSIPALSAAAEKLMRRIEQKQDELRRREQSCGKSHDVRKMNKLRDEIASLEVRLGRCFTLLEGL